MLRVATIVSEAPITSDLSKARLVLVVRDLVARHCDLLAAITGYRLMGAVKAMLFDESYVD